MIFNLTQKLQRNNLHWIILTGVIFIAGFAAIKISDLESRWVGLVFLGGLFFFAVVIWGDIRRAFLTLVLLDIPFNLDINFGLRVDIPDAGLIAGWSFSITSIALIFLYSIWILETLAEKHKKSQPLIYTSDILPLALYLMFCLLSIFVARDMQLAMFKNFLLLQQFLLFIYIIGTVKTRQDIEFLLGVIFAGVILEGFIVIGLTQIGSTVKLAGLTARVDHGFRIGGTIGGPNQAGSYFGFLIIPALSMLITDVKNIVRWLGLLAFFTGLIAIIFTYSRGGWTAFAASAIIFIIISFFKGWLPVRVPLLLAAAAVIMFISFHELLIDRLFGDDEGAAFSRIPLMKLAFNVISTHPFLGVGINNFAIVMRDYITRELSGLWLFTVHNKYLLVWAETGTGGFLAYLWFLGSGIRKGWKSWQSQHPFYAPLSLALLSAIIGHMIHMNVDIFSGRPGI